MSCGAPGSRGGNVSSTFVSTRVLGGAVTVEIAGDDEAAVVGLSLSDLQAVAIVIVIGKDQGERIVGAPRLPRPGHDRYVRDIVTLVRRVANRCGRDLRRRSTAVPV